MGNHSWRSQNAACIIIHDANKTLTFATCPVADCHCEERIEASRYVSHVEIECPHLKRKLLVYCRKTGDNTFFFHCSLTGMIVIQTSAQIRYQHVMWITAGILYYSREKYIGHVCGEGKTANHKTYCSRARKLPYSLECNATAIVTQGVTFHCVQEEKNSIFGIRL